ncbi:MAG: ComF family protein [Verrucomicrobia bacterium]|nr:ComF family protein [Verrucomicrobiota bacterium]MCH8527581.1 ComF family protein [Kiritimatiellia bacterium]
MNALPRLLDIAFPRRCCGCGGGIHHETDNGLCWDCRSATHAITPPWCEQCGMAVAGRVDHAFRCSRCGETNPVYTRARSLFRYEGGIRDAVHALKYHRDFSVIPDLARLLAAGIHTHLPDPAGLHVVPVPLHPRKLRKRGFNQSHELAKVLRSHLPALTLWPHLARVKDTETQTHLSASARRRNVQGAFKVHHPPAPETVLILDDVMTTGSTVDACARALHRAGSRDITVLTLARG